MREYLPESWFDPRLRVGPSSLHGRGLLAGAGICAGETVMVWGGTAYPETDLGTGRIPGGVSYSVIAEGLVLAGPDDGMDYFLNHSCDPNVWMDDEVTVVARRDIAEDEEILIDYALVESEPGYLLTTCRCGSSWCRGTVTGQDWRDPALQERYRGHFLPFLDERAQRS